MKGLVDEAILPGRSQTPNQRLPPRRGRVDYLLHCKSVHASIALTKDAAQTAPTANGSACDRIAENAGRLADADVPPKRRSRLREVDY